MSYTPTTDEVDTGFTSFAWDLTREEPGAYGTDSGFEDYHEVCAAFRRWLTEERAKVWDKAVDTLSAHYEDIIPGIVKDLERRNPYRAA